MVEEEDGLDGIRKLYPNFADEEPQRAQETLQNYIRVMCRIYERVLRAAGPEEASNRAIDRVSVGNAAQLDAAKRNGFRYGGIGLHAQRTTIE